MQKDSAEFFCPYYDQALLIEAAPQKTIAVAMCCFQQRKIVHEVKFDHPHLEAVRQIARHRIPPQCSRYCSMPSHINNEREHAFKEDWWQPGSKHIRKLHLKQNLTCNLKCISCSSFYSSAWNGDYQVFDPTAPYAQAIKNSGDNWKHLDLSQLNQLHFDGGEPLLGTDMKNILRHLRDLDALRNVTININTNGTIMPDRELIDLWSEAKWVRVFFSLDGIESTFEYTRFPAKWYEVEQNMLAYTAIKGPCLLLEVDAVVGIHNLFNLADFYAWWRNALPYGNQGDPSKIWIKPIQANSYGGRMLALENMPSNLRDAANDILTSIADCPGAKDLITILHTDSPPDQGWKQYLDDIDKLHGTDWKSMLPQQLQEAIC